MYTYLKGMIDPAITSSDSMSDLARRPKLRTFLQSHTKSSHYSFSVVKCTSERCDVCFTRRLPADVILAHLPDPVPQADGEHYKQFQVRIGLAHCAHSRWCAWQCTQGTSSNVINFLTKKCDPLVLRIFSSHCYKCNKWNQSTTDIWHIWLR